MLCSTCTTCFVTSDLESKLRSHIHAPLRHHETFDTFLKSVQESCTVCTAVWRSMESRGHSMRRGQGPVTEFSLHMRRRAASKSAKVVTIYWHEHEERFKQQKAFSLELATDIECSTCRSDKTVQHPTATTDLSLMSQWLRNCANCHSTCNTGDKFIPTRLLDLGSSTAHWRLQVTADGSGDFFKYATLSHRWGKDSFLCLTTSKLESFKTGLPVSALSPTFQYAVAITKQLKIRYIWIDSLCIIQDSTEDWRSESGQMRRIYGHSVLTIAVLSIGPPLGRLSHDVSTVPSHICKIRPGWTDAALDDYYIFEDSMWEDCVTSAALNRRAWVLQERILSRRVLYVHETQHFWECHEQTACEIFPVRMPQQMLCTPGKISHKRARPNIEQITLGHHNYTQDPYFFWKRVVDKYTLCQLTEPEDKLVAISGLAQRVAAVTNDLYLAGLWRRHLPSQLMWEVQDPPITTFSNPALPGSLLYRAPSWSWASIDGSALIRSPDTDQDILSLVEILSIDVKTVTEDRTGQVQNGFITMRGMLIPAAYYLDTSRSSKGRLVVALMSSSKESSIFVFFDVRPDAAVEGLLCLPVYHYLSPEAEGEKGKAGVEGLVLRRSDTMATCYQRFGIFSMYGRPLCQLAGLDFSGKEEGELGEIAVARATQNVVIA